MKRNNQKRIQTSALLMSLTLVSFSAQAGEKNGTGFRTTVESVAQVDWKHQGDSGKISLWGGAEFTNSYFGRIGGKDRLILDLFGTGGIFLNEKGSGLYTVADAALLVKILKGSTCSLVAGPSGHFHGQIHFENESENGLEGIVKAELGALCNEFSITALAGKGLNPNDLDDIRSEFAARFRLRVKSWLVDGTLGVKDRLMSEGLFFGGCAGAKYFFQNSSLFAGLSACLEVNPDAAAVSTREVVNEREKFLQDETALRASFSGVVGLAF